MIKKIEFHFNLQEKFTNFTIFLKLCFIILIIGHYTACGFIMLGKL